MVATRSKGSGTKPADGEEKRPPPSSGSNKGIKKQKTETDGKLEVGDDGEVGLKKEDDNKDHKGGEKDAKEEVKAGEDMKMTREEMKAEEGKKAEKGEDEVDQKALQGIKGELEEPKHGKQSLQSSGVLECL